MIATIPTLLTLASVAVAKFDPSAGNSVAIVLDDDTKLEDFCSDDSVDAVIIPLLDFTQLDKDWSSIKFKARNCEDNGKTTKNNRVSNCPGYIPGIEKCKKNKKQVFGQLTGLEGFESENQAQQFADSVWYMFGNNMAGLRPFGKNVLDGVIADTTTKLQSNKVGWAPFIKRLQTYFKHDKSDNQFWTGVNAKCESPDDDTKESGKLADLIIVDNSFDECKNNAQAMKEWRNDLDKKGLLMGVNGKEQNSDFAKQVQQASCNFAGVAVHLPSKASSLKDWNLDERKGGCASSDPSTTKN